jgi:hypothetical protein
MQLTGFNNIVGFEYEPNLFKMETVTAKFYNQLDQLIDTITMQIDGKSGAALFALQDTVYGDSIRCITLSNDSGDSFAIAELRAGCKRAVPEPGTGSLLSLGILGLLGLVYKKFAVAFSK